MPPLTKLDPDRLVADGVVPANLKTAIVRESDFNRGYALTELTPTGQTTGRTPGPSSRWVSHTERRLRALLRATGSGRASRSRSRLALHLLPRGRVAIRCVAFGSVDPIFQTPSPEWNPLNWNTSAFEFVLGAVHEWRGLPDGFVRTFVLRRPRARAVAAHRLPGGVLLARYGGRWKGLLLVGLIAPFWISTSCGCWPGSTCSRTTAG